MKTCSKCKESLPVSEFNSEKRAKDGLRSACKRCAREALEAHRRRTARPCLDCGTPTCRGGVQRCARCNGKLRSGPAHHNFKGGRHVTPEGYVYLSGFQDHPNANQVGQISEHVLVMSSVLGRPLVKGENVHHKNGQRDDNRPENLELWSRSQPPGQRVEDKVAWAIELLRLYRPEILKEDE